jgi:protein phosphatase
MVYPERYDIVGDIHGCYDEFVHLLNILGYSSKTNWRHPEDRRLIFLGDFIDRGPKIWEVVTLIIELTQTVGAICLLGNHEVLFLRHMCGNGKELIMNGLESTLEQLHYQDYSICSKLIAFIKNISPIHSLVDDSLIVTHAGLLPNSKSFFDMETWEFAVFGTKKKPDKNVLKIQRSKSWISLNSNSALIVYGHYAKRNVQIEGRTICIDTGCVFGGALTALRFPEEIFVSVPARDVYYQPPLGF